ncbi:hypothetical protein [Paenibacillus sp. GP183]|uniref:hypothetical protein n=1 Tax=Paenibacillus sp. GP183 TaxID=1882751 RepID=UPI0014958A68|nr:hypothetical protein [Paenibacillus sp. GP183]
MKLSQGSLAALGQPLIFLPRIPSHIVLLENVQSIKTSEGIRAEDGTSARSSRESGWNGKKYRCRAL